MSHRRGRHRARPAASRRRQLIALSAACALAATGLEVLTAEPGAPAPGADAAPAADVTRAAAGGVSRDYVRTAPSLPASASPSAVPLPPSPSPSSASPKPPAPVAGLDRAQMANAGTIVQVGKRRGLPKRALVVAIATALQESDLRNVASPAVPESLEYPHQGEEVDHDSVGIFQQRPSQGWGTVAQLMDPGYAAGQFFDRLVLVPDWADLSVTEAAQAVQRSAFPDAYAQHESVATQVVAALA